jgi:hypothetical protein
MREVERYINLADGRKRCRAKSVGNAPRWKSYINPPPHDGMFIGFESRNFLTFCMPSLRLKSAERLDGWSSLQPSYSRRSRGGAFELIL